jgi:hypothetical protein
MGVSRGRGRVAVAIALVLSAVLVGCSDPGTAPTSTSTATTTSQHSTPPSCPRGFAQLPSATQTPGPSVPTILPTPLDYVVLCRYAPYPSQSLTDSVTITTGSHLALLRSEVDALVPLSPDDRYPCPLDRGARIDAYFGSASGTLELRFDLRGCQFITGSNAAYYGLSKASSRLLAEVESLVH